MSVQGSGDKLPRFCAKPSTDGPLSLLLGLLAILAVVAESQILLFFWAGRENPVLQFLFIGSPLVVILLAASAQSLGREGCSGGTASPF